MPTLVVAPQRDSFMQSGNDKDLNFGSAVGVGLGSLFLGGAKQYTDRAIVNFDVSALAGATILSAKLVREIYSTIGTPAATIYRCTRPAQWTEASVTWNRYDGVAVWTAEGGDYDLTTPGPVHFIEPAAEISGLGGFVEDALANRGGIVSLLMKVDDELSNVGRAFWRSREYFGSGDWHLDVDYGDIENPGRRSATRHGGPSVDVHMSERRPRQPAPARRPRQPRNHEKGRRT